MAAQSVLRSGIPIAATGWLRQVEIGGGLDTIRQSVGEFVLVVPGALAGKFSGRSARIGSAMALCNHRVVGFQLQHPWAFGGVGLDLKFPGINLRIGGRSEGNR